jgi:hypothetical protein
VKTTSIPIGINKILMPGKNLRVGINPGFSINRNNFELKSGPETLNFIETKINFYIGGYIEMTNIYLEAKVLKLNDDNTLNLNFGFLF